MGDNTCPEALPAVTETSPALAISSATEECGSAEGACSETAFATNTKCCRPFLKWAGGKRQVLPQLMSRIPENFEVYFEPFVGGGALFFALQPSRAVLSDVNAELMSCYTAVRDQVEELIRTLSAHRYEKEYYYKLRNADRSIEFQAWTAVERAGRLIYLNKTCFNGLYRVNSRGEFNVPFGKYSDPRICDSSNLRACSTALQEVELCSAKYTSILKRVQKGDFVYLDPPYAPLTATANFTDYSAEGFGESEQLELRNFCRELDSRGVKFLLSNSSAQLILDLYAEFGLEFISAGRAINSKANKRGKVQEVLVRNY